jgi:branched-chain amino acid transport system permease protein
MSAGIDGLPIELAAGSAAPGRRRRVSWIVWTIVLIALFVLPAFAPEVIGISDAATICALAVVAMGQNVVTALSGQMSLGQGAMAAFGAYGYAILVNDHVPAVLAFLVAPLCAAVVGGIVALWAVRLSGLYLAMVTLAVVVAVPALAQWSGLQWLTNGYQGLTLPVPTISILGSTDLFLYALSALVCALVAWFVSRLKQTRQGLALRVMGQSELTAALSGVGLFRSRMFAFCISAVLAAFGGELLGLITGIVSPDSYSLLFSVGFIVMIVLGGFGTNIGALIGAAIVWELQTRVPSVAVPIGGAQIDILPGVIYGLLVMVFIVLLPGGVVGAVRRIRERGTRAPRSSSPGPTPGSAPSPASTDQKETIA